MAKLGKAKTRIAVVTATCEPIFAGFERQRGALVATFTPGPTRYYVLGVRVPRRVAQRAVEIVRRRR